MRKFWTTVILIGGLALAACNTVEGVGEDVSSAGKTVADVADDAK